MFAAKHRNWVYHISNVFGKTRPWSEIERGTHRHKYILDVLT